MYKNRSGTFCDELTGLFKFDVVHFRHNEVHKKGPDDICAYFDVKGKPLWLHLF